MNKNKFQRNMGKVVLAFSLVFGFIFLTSTTANAQWRDNNGRDNRNNDRNDRDRRNDNGGYSNDGYYNNTARIALENGFRDGFGVGRSDAYDRDRFNPQNSREFKKGTNGYSSRFGNKDAYKRAYQEGFLRGYRQGYEQNRQNNGGRNNGGRGW